MSNNLDRVITAAESLSSPGTLSQIIMRLSPRPTTRSLQRWLTSLVRKRRLIRTGSSTNTRYAVPRPGAAGFDGLVGLDAAGLETVRAADAVRVLIRQPPACRPPAAYRHIWLDSYRPNITRYIEPDVRAAITGQLTETAANLPPIEDLAAEFARFTCALEDPGAKWSVDVGGNSTAMTGSRVRANRANLRALDAAIRATFLKLLCAGREVELCQEALLQFVEALPEDPFPTPRTARPNEGEYVPLMRTELVAAAPWLSTSTYHPCQDGPQVEAYLDTILEKAPVISDPVEQAFFALVHVAYLQPFRVLNATTACVAFNLPLLRAGFGPITFAGISVPDFMDGMLGVWELNRIELLRDVMIRAVAGGSKSAARRTVSAAPAASSRTPVPRTEIDPPSPPTAAAVRQAVTAFDAPAGVPVRPTVRPNAPAVQPPVLPTRADPVPPNAPKSGSAALPLQPVMPQPPPSAALPPRPIPATTPPPASTPAPKPLAQTVDWAGAIGDPQVIEAVQMTVSNQLGRVAAKNYVQTAAENHADPKWFKATVSATLEALDQPHLAAFGLDARSFQKWRQTWR